MPQPKSIALFLFSGVLLAVYLSNRLFTLNDAEAAVLRLQERKIDIQTSLGVNLSESAKILFHSDAGHDEWSDATARWNTRGGPNVTAVIECSTVQDVQSAVRYAREQKLPFLVRNRGHGSSNTFQNFRGGLQINIRNLEKMEIDAKRNIVTLGGGVYTAKLSQFLFDNKKQTTTGSCTCVGLMGAALGGGHGLLQGMHGLIADQIVSAKVVLANGTLVTASDQQNTDLYWGLKGAGHNFGIVTEYEFKIYDLEEDGIWYWSMQFFTPDNLEEILELMNSIRDGQPRRLTIMASVMYASPDAPEPMIAIMVIHAGTLQKGEKFASKFRNIGSGPVFEMKNETILPLVTTETIAGLDSPLCSRGHVRSQWPVSLKELDIPSIKIAFEKFREMTQKYPDTKESFLIFEQYSREATQKIPEESTAYPHRSTNIIALFQANYTDHVHNKIADGWGRDMRHILQQKSGFAKLEAYLNYAQGVETLGEVYGHEDWRLEKLRVIKQKYDPDGQFNYYHPIQ